MRAILFKRTDTFGQVFHLIVNSAQFSIKTSHKLVFQIVVTLTGVRLVGLDEFADGVMAVTEFLNVSFELSNRPTDCIQLTVLRINILHADYSQTKPRRFAPAGSMFSSRLVD